MIALARLLARLRRAVAPAPGPITLHFRLNVATPEAVSVASACYASVRAALAPALAREAQARPRAYHLADDAGCGIPLGDFGPAHLAGPGEGRR